MTDKIIVALDYGQKEDALRMVSELSGAASFYKVGLELYTAAGPEIIRILKENKLRVFLDLKLFDIPNTVARTSRLITSFGVDFFNLHLLAGSEVLTAAGEAAREEAARRNLSAPKILGVTVLTSSSGSEWREIGIKSPTPELVLRLAERARKAGLDGVVASAQDAAGIKERFGRDFLVVSPGIRSIPLPLGERLGEGDDQKRTFTAQEAFAAGSDYIVVGRPVTRASDPRKAYEELWKK